MKTLHTISSKIARPNYSGIYERKRLFGVLDKLRKHPVIWISAAPGSGKTTLLSSYIKSRKLRNIWYQIDGGDDDPATFFYYMSLAANKAAPGRKPLPLLSPEYIPGLHTFTRRFFESLFQRLKSPSCIVFDNYQEAPEGSVLHEILSNGIEAMPEGVNIFILSRVGPPSAFARLVVNHSIEVLESSDLLLSRQEAHDLTRLKGSTSPEVLDAVYRTTNGWMAGFTLLMKSTAKGRQDGIREVTSETIFTYFDSEILRRLDQETRAFMTKTALLPSMDAEIAVKLTGNDEARQILSKLNNNNCFTEKRNHANPIYQYHPLFREFLLSKLNDSYELTELKRHAAGLLKNSGMIEDAFDLYAEAKDINGMFGMVMDNARPLLAQSRHKLLERWIRAIPEEVSESNPWLLYWLGACGLPFDPSRSLKEFKLAFRSFKEQKDGSGSFLAWSGIINSIYFETKDYAQFDTWIPVLSELTREFETPEGEVGAAVATSMHMALVTRQPRHPDFVFWEKRAFELIEECSDINLKTQVLADCVWYGIVAGEFAKTVMALDKFGGLVRSVDASPLTALTVKWLEATYFTMIAQHEKCLEAVSKGLSLADASGVHMMDFMILGTGALSCLNTGDRRSAEKFLNDLRMRMAMARPLDRAFYNFVQAHNELHHGAITMARYNIEQALDITREIGLPVAEFFCRVETAHIIHTMGEHRTAYNHLEEGRNIAELFNSNDKKFLCFLTDAHFAFESGKHEDGLEALRKALAYGKECDYTNTFMWFPSVMAGLCRRAIEAGIEVEYVRSLIKKRNIAQNVPPIDIENWPWPVRIYTFGRFGLEADGKPVQFSGKVQKKPLELLKLLVASGGRSMKETSVMDHLWPDSEGDSAYRALRTTVHRLRKLPGFRKSIQVSNGAITLDPNTCWVDVWAFERILGQAEGAFNNGACSSSSFSFLEKAISMYRGPFLSEDMDKSWAISARERLRGKLLRHIGEAAKSLHTAGEFEKTIPLLEKGIEIDPVAEAFYQALIMSYKKLGMRAEGLAVYERLKKNLSSTFGINPSPRTEELRREILSDTASR